MYLSHYEQTLTRAYHPPPLHIFCFGRQSLDPGEVLIVARLTACHNFNGSS